MNYADDLIVIDDHGIKIRDYYFPTMTEKFIKWSDVKKVTSFSMTPLKGQYRIWGMGLAPYWFNLDSGRTNKTTAFIVDTGQFIKSALTPREPDKVREIFASRKLF